MRKNFIPGRLRSCFVLVMFLPMTDRRPSLADLFTAYSRALVAKLQMREFGNWGGGVMERFRQTVAEHEELEREYLDRVSADRAAADQAGKDERR